MAKTKYFQMRLIEGDEELLDELTEDYGLDRSRLVRLALEYIREHRPSFVILPQGKETAPAMEIAYN